MRKTFYPTALVILLSNFSISCEEIIPEDLAAKNHLKIGNIEYAISSGSLENYGQDETYEGTNIDLILFSKDIKMSTDDDGERELTGSGDVIYFEMFTSTETSLNSGIYNYREESPYPNGTFSQAVYVLGWESGGNNDENLVVIPSGVVSVDKYEITIACKDTEGNSVTGYYKGRLQYYDETSTSESARVKPKRERHNYLSR